VGALVAESRTALVY